MKKISKNVYYHIDFWHRLIIFGSGNIPRYIPKEPEKIHINDDSYVQNCYTYNFAPWSKEYVTEIIICKGIKKIGAYAFSGMTAVHKVKIAGTVEFIGKGCFKECSLISEIEFANDKAEIHPTAFLGVDLGTLKFKKKKADGLVLLESGLYHIERGELLIGADRKEVRVERWAEVINPYAFACHNNVEKVVCPDSLEIIGVSAFEDCKNLREISAVPDNCVIGKNSLRGTEKVRVFRTDRYEGNIKEERPIVAISEQGTGYLQNGEFIFYTENVDTSIDPTVFYQHQDLIDIKGGENFMIGLRATGDVVYADDIRYENIFEDFLEPAIFGKCHKWKNVCQIAAGKTVAAALREDGTVYCTAAQNPNLTLELLEDIVYIELDKNDVLYAANKEGKVIKIIYDNKNEGYQSCYQ